MAYELQIDFVPGLCFPLPNGNIAFWSPPTPIFKSSLPIIGQGKTVEEAIDNYEHVAALTVIIPEMLQNRFPSQK